MQTWFVILILILNLSQFVWSLGLAFGQRWTLPQSTQRHIHSAHSNLEYEWQIRSLQLWWPFVTWKNQFHAWSLCNRHTRGTRSRKRSRGSPIRSLPAGYNWSFTRFNTFCFVGCPLFSNIFTPWTNLVHIITWVWRIQLSCQGDQHCANQGCPVNFIFNVWNNLFIHQHSPISSPGKESRSF